MKINIPVGLVLVLIGLLAMADNHSSIGAFVVGFSIFLFDRTLVEFEYNPKK